MKNNDVEIIQASSKQEFDQVRILFREYEAYLNIDISFQDFENECIELPGKYAPPSGQLLLCIYNSKIAGCVALKKLQDNICEMKRLYVRPDYRKKGLGKLLSTRVIEEAINMGCATMRLDTLVRLKVAFELYRSLGFKEIAPYYYNPLPDVVFLELDLKQR